MHKLILILRNHFICFLFFPYKHLSRKNLTKHTSNNTLTRTSSCGMDICDDQTGMRKAF